MVLVILLTAFIFKMPSSSSSSIGNGAVGVMSVTGKFEKISFMLVSASASVKYHLKSNLLEDGYPVLYLNDTSFSSPCANITGSSISIHAKMMRGAGGGGAANAIDLNLFREFANAAVSSSVL